MELNWFLLVLCVLLLVVSSFIVFCMRAIYRLDVVIANEKKPLQIECASRVDLDNLNDALLQAMDYYRGNPAFTPEFQTATNEIA